jgi:YidC/Oxa1 family membrane protein insertase
LKSYDRNKDIVALGWGILGLIDMHSYVYGFLSMFIQHGWAIILFTILVKLVLSPITYKSFCLRQNESIEPEIMNWGRNSKKTQ